MKIRRLTYLVNIIAAIATITIGMRAVSFPMSFSQILIIAWGVIPYGYLSFISSLGLKVISNYIVLMLSIFAGGYGVWLLLDSMVFNLDAQSGLVYMYVPGWQLMIFLIITLPMLLLFER